MISKIYDIEKNVPKVHPLIKKSFIYINKVGMRVSPEILLIELYREIFFEKHYGDRGNKGLDPHEKVNNVFFYSKNERAVIYALQGRRKKTKQSKDERFYAPAYPKLARGCWLGKSRERVIKNLLFNGVVAQHLWGRGLDVSESKVKRDEMIDLLWKSFVGNASVINGEYHDKEILSVALNTDSEYILDADLAKRNLKEMIDETSQVVSISDDELASRIFKDLRYICILEGRIPRLQWLQLLMTFLRFTLPMWLLAQMQTTSLLHYWLIRAIDKGEIIDLKEVKQAISSRNKSLLHLTLTPTREIYSRIENFVKHYVELNILLQCLGKTKDVDILNKELDIEEGGSNKISIGELLSIAKNASAELKSSDRYQKVAAGLDFRKFLIREGENFPGWRNPLKKGDGKNIDEFIRVLYKDTMGDEVGGYLLVSEGRGSNRGFCVFPGQQLLKMITYFANQDKMASTTSNYKGKLVLGDVENHFQQYGIDFTSTADARPLIMEEMKALGLLTGSPDAGSSVAVTCPY